MSTSTSTSPVPPNSPAITVSSPPPTPSPSPSLSLSLLGIPSCKKKRKFDQLDPPSRPLPPNGSILYVALYALRPINVHSGDGGALNYDWTFLLAPDDGDEKSDTNIHGRQYLMRERTVGRGLGELGMEQRRRRVQMALPTGRQLLGDVGYARPSEYVGSSQWSQDFFRYAAQQASAWELEIQDVPMSSQSTTSIRWPARIRIQLCRVRDVEMFEACVKDVYLESENNKGLDWYRVLWMADAWKALAEMGDVLYFAGEGMELGPVDWQTVQGTAVSFVETMESGERFGLGKPTGRVPTWGLLENRLLVS